MVPEGSPVSQSAKVGSQAAIPSQVGSSPLSTRPRNITAVAPKLRANTWQQPVADEVQQAGWLRNVNKRVLGSLQSMLRVRNRLVLHFLTMVSQLRSMTDMEMVLRREIGELEPRRRADVDRRRYNAPTAGEVAVILPEEEVALRDIMLTKPDGGTQQISQLCPIYV